MLKTYTEAEEKLRERYSGPTEQRKGFYDKFTGQDVYFTYIPWEEAVKQLNAVFGVFGWSVTPPVAVYGDGFWTVTFGLIARVLDDDGNVIEKMVPCADSAEGGDSHAAKKAMSGALVKGSQLLGDAFGFFIGPEAKAKKRSEYQASSAPRPQSAAPRQAASAGDRRPSDKQMFTLTSPDRLGFTPEEVAAMDFSTWKGHLDTYFQQAKGGF